MNKQFILLVASSWAICLITALLVVYVVPSLFPSRTGDSQIEIVRFSHSVERNVTSNSSYPLPMNITSFVWTPDNPRENIILSIYCTIEHRCGNPPSYVWGWQGVFWWELKMDVAVNGHAVEGCTVTESAYSASHWQELGITEWKQICFMLKSDADSLWINPNQESYTITFRTHHADRASGATPTYIRNLNIIIEVA